MRCKKDPLWVHPIYFSRIRAGTEKAKFGGLTGLYIIHVYTI